MSAGNWSSACSRTHFSANPDRSNHRTTTPLHYPERQRRNIDSSCLLVLTLLDETLLRWRRRGSKLISLSLVVTALAPPAPFTVVKHVRNLPAVFEQTLINHKSGYTEESTHAKPLRASSRCATCRCIMQPGDAILGSDRSYVRSAKADSGRVPGFAPQICPALLRVIWMKRCKHSQHHRKLTTQQHVVTGLRLHAAANLSQH